MQTRLLHFGDRQAPQSTPRSWQGISVGAVADAGANVPLQLRPAPRSATDAAGAAAGSGTLKVVTTNLRPGYLRKNGVPYSANAVLDGVLGSLQAAERRRMADDHDADRRPAVSAPASTDCVAVQEGSERGEMGSNAVFGALVTQPRRLFALGSVCACSSLRHAFRCWRRSICRVRGRDECRPTTATRGAGRSAGHSGQRRRPRQGAELQHRVAVGHRAPVSDVSAVLSRSPVRSRFRSSGEQDPITQKLVAWKIAGWIDRDVHDDLDGRPPAPVGVRAAHARRLHDRAHGKATALVAVTTHFKMGDMKRHRAFSSDRRRMTYRFTRHDDSSRSPGFSTIPCTSPSRSS